MDQPRSAFGYYGGDGGYVHRSHAFTGNTVYPFVLGGHIFAGTTTVIGGVLVNRWTGLDGLYYWWSVIAVWVVMLAVIFTSRYLHGGWQTKRVIEPPITD